MDQLPDTSQIVCELTPVAGDMEVAEWGDLIAVYHRPSGETHVFNEITAAFLRTLQSEGPGSLDAVVDRVAAMIGIAEDHVAPKDFLSVVLRLEELGLIKRTHAGLSPA